MATFVKSLVVDKGLVQSGTSGNPDLAADVTGTLPVAHGGTNATTAAGARTNLNVDVAGTAASLIATHEAAGDPHPQYTTAAELSAYAQPLDADLTSLAAASSTGVLYYRSAAGTWSVVTIGANLTFSGGTLAASSGGATTLDGLSDVVITTPATGAILVYNGSEWVDGKVDLADTDAVTGTLPIANVAAPTDTTAPAPASDFVVISDFAGAWRKYQIDNFLGVGSRVHVNQTSDQGPLTSSAWNTITGWTETTDALGEWASDGFTPDETGWHEIEARVFLAVTTGRNILSIWEGTSAELTGGRFADRNESDMFGVLTLYLTAGTTYRIRAFPVGHAPTTTATLTAVNIRRKF